MTKLSNSLRLAVDHVREHTHRYPESAYEPTASFAGCPTPSGGALTYSFGDGRDPITIQVGPNEPSACVTARLIAAINGV